MPVVPSRVVKVGEGPYTSMTVRPRVKMNLENKWTRTLRLSIKLDADISGKLNAAFLRCVGFGLTPAKIDEFFDRVEKANEVAELQGRAIGSKCMEKDAQWYQEHWHEEESRCSTDVYEAEFALEKLGVEYETPTPDDWQEIAEKARKGKFPIAPLDLSLILTDTDTPTP